MSLENKIDSLVKIIALNKESRIVSKIRLQKTLYLLQLCGLKTNFDYEYHNYGPYSFELSDVSNEASFAGLLKTEDRAGYYSIPYTVFESGVDESAIDNVGELSKDIIKSKLGIMENYTAVELELAATMAFLKNECGEESKDIEDITKSLKLTKSTSQNIAKAKKVLADLDIKI